MASRMVRVFISRFPLHPRTCGTLRRSILLDRTEHYDYKRAWIVQSYSSDLVSSSTGSRNSFQKRTRRNATTFATFVLSGAVLTLPQRQDWQLWSLRLRLRDFGPFLYVSELGQRERRNYYTDVTRSKAMRKRAPISSRYRPDSFVS